jgi:mycoredoxin
VRSALDQAGIAYEYINIRQDEAGRARVREINAGCESVPTLVFPDGSTLTEPSPHALQQKLDRLDLQPGAALDPEGALPRYTALALAGAGGAVLLGGLVLDIPAAQVGGVLLLLVWMGRWFFRGRA